MTSEIKTASRFDDRVENYVAYRPGYPAGVIEFLRDELGLRPETVVADIGSGTGILSEMLLKNAAPEVRYTRLLRATTLDAP